MADRDARIQHLVYDFGWRIMPHHAGTSDVVIVAIDEASLAQYGRWPWSRSLDAELIEKVCQANPKVIGVDIAFTEQGTDFLGNSSLRDAIAACGKVVLPVLIEAARDEGQIRELPPIPELAAAAAGLGRIGVVLDSDGIARSVNLWEGIGAPVWPLMAQTLLTIAKTPITLSPPPKHTLSHPYQLVAQDNRLLNFIGPSGSVPTVSAQAILSDTAPMAALKHRVVLIGATAAGMGDFISTPATTQGAPMAGVEVIANSLISMEQNQLKQPLPIAWVLVLTGVLALIPLVWLNRLMPLPGLIASIVWFGFILITTALFPFITGYYFSPTGILVAALSAYPLWSWRRLEVARKHLNKELLRLLPYQPTTLRTVNNIKPLTFEQRIAVIQEAQAHLQELQAERDEMLDFISHDIRVPLANAAQQLASGALNEINRNRLAVQLKRGHELAQNYLSLSRALATKPDSFQEMELNSMLEQAIDSLYDLAQAQQVALIRQLPAHDIWIKGDFSLLERATINLISNALSFTPAGGQVIVSLIQNIHTVTWSVQDSGPGIPADVLPRLFQRFLRGNSNRAGSTGLGLYFVRTVVEKHAGTVQAENTTHGAKFSISLPLPNPEDFQN
ncbi:MAG: CHASE2 domain-containing protein [Halothiobacillus sp.]